MKRNIQNLDAKMHQKTLFGILGSTFVFLATFLSSGFTLQATINDPTSAESYSIGNTDYTISSTIEGTIDVSIRPSSTNTIITDSQDLIISTTCPSGYTISISTDSNNSNLYKDASNSSLYYLSPAAGSISSPSSLSDNQWGFNTNKSTTNFSKVPTTTSLIKTINSESNMERTTFTYGFKTASSLVAGNYIGTVTYSIAPHPDCYKQLDREFKAAFKAAGKTTATGSDGRQYYKMQDMEQTICDAAPTPTKTIIDVPEIKLVDTRDSSIYLVRKLADGNCWMADNLRLVGSKTLTSSDSDVTSNWTLPAASTSGFNTNNVANVGPVNTTYGNGAYYSWYAATAGTGDASVTARNAEAPSSICPKGWRLPYSGTTQTGSKSFKYLVDTYGYTTGDQLTAQPLQFDYSGFYLSSSFNNGGSLGSYWSSTAYSSGVAYRLYLYSSGVNPQSNYDRYDGFSVRCVSRATPENNSPMTQALKNANAEFEEAADGKAYYKMQAMNSDICNAIATPDKSATSVPEATMIDIRDKELYTVRKLADGNCWMTQNLRLNLSDSTPLTPEDSDVSGDWTPPNSTYTTPDTYWAFSVGNEAYSYVNPDQPEDGVYYSWRAAIADTSERMPKKGSSSVCPKGWRIPDGASVTDKSFNSLVTAYYGTGNYTQHGGGALNPPMSVILTGNYNPNYLQVRNAGGVVNVWSSEANSAGRIYTLYVTSTHVDTTQVPMDMSYGNAVRCVVRGPQYTVNFNSSDASYGISSALAEYGTKLDFAYYASLFKRSGYNIKEWRDQDGTVYSVLGPNTDANPNNKSSITLTAVWEKISPFLEPFKNSGSMQIPAIGSSNPNQKFYAMQDMDSSICNAVPTPGAFDTDVPEITLIDSRDYNLYTVRKIADGNCWMTQNLRLVGPRTLSSSDSDVASSFSLPAPSATGFTSADDNAVQVGPIQKDYGNGAYYSWTAATAGSGKTSGFVSPTYANDAQYSICPSGWKLPGNMDTEKTFGRLSSAHSVYYASDMTTYPMQFGYDGYYSNNAFVDGGYSGYYWGSSTIRAKYAYSLYLDASSYTSSAHTGQEINRYYGFPVRCVAR